MVCVSCVCVLSGPPFFAPLPSLSVLTAQPSTPPTGLKTDRDGLDQRARGVYDLRRPRLWQQGLIGSMSRRGCAAVAVDPVVVFARRCNGSRPIRNKSWARCKDARTSALLGQCNWNQWLVMSSSSSSSSCSFAQIKPLARPFGVSPNPFNIIHSVSTNLRVFRTRHIPTLYDRGKNTQKMPSSNTSSRGGGGFRTRVLLLLVALLVGAVGHSILMDVLSSLPHPGAPMLDEFVVYDDARPSRESVVVKGRRPRGEQERGRGN